MAALTLHAGLLAQWPAPLATPLRARSLQVRLRPVGTDRAVALGSPSPAHAAVPSAAAVATPGTMASPALPSSRPVDVPRAHAEGRADAALASARLVLEPMTPATAAGRADPRSRSSVTAMSAAPAALDIPVYPTALPPPGHWHYRLLHDGRTGEAELRWQRDGERYSAALDAHEADGASVLTFSSRGRIDGAGFAPERFVDWRSRRGAQAANFQRDAGAITYSGPALRAPLPAGAQDRLSLWLQLSAIVAAAPGRWSAGSTITTYASGAHGDAEAWRWQVLGLVATDADDAASAPAGPRALKLWRAAPRAYDTEAEAWLDPARGYLPLRLRWRNGVHVLELRLQP